MDTISGFWAGAQDYGRGVDLVELRDKAGSWDALEAASVSDLVGLGVGEERARKWLSVGSRRTLGVALRLCDPRYPRLLKQIPQAPPVLFVQGDLDCLKPSPAVAVVGTRSCTAYGRGVAHHLGHALGRAGVVVVSGLARGIDGCAHRAALQVGRTVAVFGHGLASTAPASHRELRNQILDNEGLVLSTWPDDVPPRPHTFPIRNRWIAGLAHTVVVVEAARRSGARITAMHALELGRDVVAVPGPLGASASQGCLALLAEGAGVLSNVEEFVSQWGTFEAEGQERWLSALFAGGSLQQASRLAGCTVVELMAELSRRELRGEVVRLPGHGYAPGRSHP